MQASLLDQLSQHLKLSCLWCKGQLQLNAGAAATALAVAQQQLQWLAQQTARSSYQQRMTLLAQLLIVSSILGQGPVMLQQQHCTLMVVAGHAAACMCKKLQCHMYLLVERWQASSHICNSSKSGREVSLSSNRSSSSGSLTLSHACQCWHAELCLLSLQGAAHLHRAAPAAAVVTTAAAGTAALQGTRKQVATVVTLAVLWHLTSSVTL
jgi:hypothetical protein